MDISDKISIGLNILAIIMIALVIILCIMSNDVSRIRGMWDGMLLSWSTYRIHTIISDKENRNG